MKTSLAIFFLLFFFMASTAAANPFLQGGSAGSSSAAALLGGPFAQELLAFQKRIHEAMTENVQAIKAGQGLLPLLWLLVGSFFYGVFHVLAPGHGKIIIASYFLGNNARWREGILAALIMSVGHTITAIGIVTVLYILLGLSQFGTLSTARYVELFGYGLIVAIGVWIFWKKIQDEETCSHCGHSHGAQEAHKDADKKGISLFTATSLVPCTGSMIILLFTLANGLLWAGVLAVIAIAVGMWLTMTAIGLLSILVRKRSSLLHKYFSESAIKTLRKMFGVLAAASIIIVGLMFFSATLSGIV